MTSYSTLIKTTQLNDDDFLIRILYRTNYVLLLLHSITLLSCVCQLFACMYVYLVPFSSYSFRRKWPILTYPICVWCPVGMITFDSRRDLWHPKTRVPALSCGIICVILRLAVFSARCNIYISRLCYDVSVRLSVTEVHWVVVHAGNTAAASEVEAIIWSPTNMADVAAVEGSGHLALC